MQSKYLFQKKPELLDMNAMEMDNTLKGLLAAFPNGQKVEFITPRGTTRSFKVNQNEKLLEGRGIKGFFNEFEPDRLFIEPLKSGQFCISAMPLPSKQQQNAWARRLEEPVRMDKVLSAFASFSQSESRWFSLYHEAQGLKAWDEDTLVSLPHLRDLSMFQYQIKTVKSVLNRFRGRAMLCDEVGLGKTVEAGMAMTEYIMRGLVKTVLVLVPPSLVEQWYQEMLHKFNQDFIKYDDWEFKRAGSEAWSRFPKIIASLSTAKRAANREDILACHYDLVIVDEAHHLKNRSTAAWQFVNSLSKKYILLLTATPVQNNLEELYNLITLLKPGQLKTYSYFKRNFIKDKEGMEAQNVEKLRGLLSDVMIRNKRSDIDIPFTSRRAYTYALELGYGEKRLYDSLSGYIKDKYQQEDSRLTRFVLKSLQEEMGSSFYALVPTLEKLSRDERMNEFERKVLYAFLEEARHVTELEALKSPKAQQLLRILREFKDKMVLFTKFRATQSFLSSFLRDSGFEVAEFHGSMRRTEKEEQIELFRRSAQVLVSTESGGEGRNLQFCNGLINYDLPWNPMAIEQRIGRIHRVGQTRPVYVYNLAAKDTVEAYILDLLDKKINMFELVVGEVDMILGDLEETEDFSERVMNAWVRSSTEADMSREMDVLGDLLMANKKQHLRIRDLDDKLFG